MALKNIGAGPRMIGKAKFDLIKATTQDRSARMGLGPRMQSPKTKAKVAAAQAKLKTAQQAYDETPKHLRGPKATLEVRKEPVVAEVTDETQSGLATTEPGDAGEVVQGYSTEQVKALLKEAPGRVLDVWDMEQARPDGLRKGVLKLLFATEAAKGEEGDKVLLDAISKALAKLS